MTDKAISPLRRRMIEDMTIRKFAPKTQHDDVQRVVCHEYRRSKRRYATVREMKEGPSRPAVRFWPQTAASCCRQKRWW